MFDLLDILEHSVTDNVTAEGSSVTFSDILKNSAFEDTLDDTWQGNTEAALRKPENSKLYDIFNRMGIYMLPMEQRKAFWFMVWHFYKFFSEPVVFTGGICHEKYVPELKSGIGHLIQYGLVEFVSVSSVCDEKAESAYFLLSVHAAGQIFGGCDYVVSYAGISQYASIILSCNIAETDLFFTEKEKGFFKRMQYMVSPEGLSRIKTLLSLRNRNLVISCLISGASGTGKTEMVKQLARQSGRTLVMLDIKKLYNTYWGEPEKVFCTVIREYSYLSVVSSNPPILLLKEVDSILSKHATALELSIEKSESNIVNVVLQELEKAGGLIFATTNIIENIDEVFNRRFLFKLQMEKPDACARRKIWRSAIPELDEESIECLATRYRLTGAQIKNIALKRDIAELYYGGNRDLPFIITLCKEELQIDLHGVRQK